MTLNKLSMHCMKEESNACSLVLDLDNLSVLIALSKSGISSVGLYYCFHFKSVFKFLLT